MPKKFLFTVILILLSIPVAAQTTTRYELNSISFKGNNSFSSSALHDVIYSKETPWWFWKFLHSFSSLGKESSYFDSTNIILDLTALKDYYTANGFFDAKFSYDYKVDTADKEVDLTYIIKEKKSADFGKLNVQGLKKVPDFLAPFLKEDLNFDTTQRYSQNTVQNQTNKVITDLLNNGYIFAKFDSTIVIKDTVKNEAGINMYFTTGKRYQIDSILVKKNGLGAHLVANSMLKRITGLKPGAFYQQDVVRRSQLRLYRTGLFDAVTLGAKESDTTGSEVPIQLTGSIGLMNELSLKLFLTTSKEQLTWVSAWLIFVRISLAMPVN